jgi:hypothetical protein
MIKTIDLTQSALPITSGHLRLGGTNPQGRSIEVTNYYLLQDGKPCIPVMGEFHFSRYPHQYWEEELLKMKAGGVDMVATYVFWNHIEEDEGVFDWSGNRDLRQFVTLCGRHQLDVIVRIGPFAHGECRNGGLPDWIYGRPFQVRSIDPRYLVYVERLYNAIASQLEGLLFKDSGPVIGIQLENEYMHCGAPWEVTFKPGTEWVPRGEDGADHLMALKQLAQKAGLDVPLYTCTGWLNSPVPDGEMLPMQGGYAFTPWSPDPNYRQAPTREFLFRNRHLSPVLNGPATYNGALYPYACCEIGGGIQITYYHRPIVPPECVEALALMNLAGGANVIGYYMYHGGSNPTGKHSYMNEFTVPRISYDFQAPLGEFGQFADSYRYLRLLHRFLKDFGDLLAPMTVTLPDDAGSITPETTADLRWMVRSRDGAGFVFLNNYQDHVDMQDIPDIRFELHVAGKTLSMPHDHSFTLQKNVSAILPFGLSLDGVCLEYATTQLLARLADDNAITYIFFAPRGMSGEYAFDSATYQSITATSATVHESDGYAYITVTPGTDCLISFTNADGKAIHILTLTRDQAEDCSKQQLQGKDRLIISDAAVVISDEQCLLYNIGQPDVDVLIYPPLEQKLTTHAGECTKSVDGLFIRYTANLPPKTISLDIETLSSAQALLKLNRDMLDGLDNLFLRIAYVGDIGNAFINGKLVSDNFYNGTTWEIGLKQLLADRSDSQIELYILITPIRKQSGGVNYVPTGMAFSPDSDQDSLGMIQSITAVPSYKIPLE